MGLLPSQIREMTYPEFFIYYEGFRIANGLISDAPSDEEFADALLEEQLAGNA